MGNCRDGEKLLCNNYYKNCPHHGNNEIAANLQDASTIGDVALNIPKINATLEDRQEYYQLTMIELEGKLHSQTISVLVDPRASLSYVNPKIVERCDL